MCPAAAKSWHGRAADGLRPPGACALPEALLHPSAGTAGERANLWLRHSQHAARRRRLEPQWQRELQALRLAQGFRPQAPHYTLLRLGQLKALAPCVLFLGELPTWPSLHSLASGVQCSAQKPLKTVNGSLRCCWAGIASVIIINGPDHAHSPMLSSMTERQCGCPLMCESNSKLAAKQGAASKGCRGSGLQLQQEYCTCLLWFALAVQEHPILVNMGCCRRETVSGSVARHRSIPVQHAEADCGRAAGGSEVD